MQHTMVKKNHSAGPRQRLDKLDTLRIVLLVNFFVIREGRMFRFVFEVLKAGSVESYWVFLPLRFSTTTSLPSNP